MTHLADFAKSHPNQVVECQLCPHRCILNPGEIGRCHVRANQDGQLFALSYGHPVARLLEPIEKKTLFHFLPGSLALSLGTPGCNLQCAGCINWRISQSDSSSSLPYVSPAEIVAQALREGATGIAFTFTELAVFYEYASDIAQLARKSGLYVVAKSNGFMLPGVLKAMSAWLDAINIDLKGWRGPLHRKIIGGAVGPILQSLKLARRLGLWLEVSTLLVPGFNDDPATLTAMANFIAVELGPHTPWHLLRFFPEYQQADIPPTSQAQLARALEIGQKAGLQYIYNQTLSQGRHLQTRCPACQAILVERENHRLINHSLDNGCCPNCGLAIPGKWAISSTPGVSHA